MNEIDFQYAFKRYVMDTNPTLATTQGKKVVFLSIGEHNHSAGPDFFSACAKVNDILYVGDVELHKKSSDWNLHQHSKNPEYENVFLHIVFECDKPYPLNCDILEIDKKLLSKYLTPQLEWKNTIEISDELQYFALVRLLRRVTDAYNLVHDFSIQDSFNIIVSNYIDRYLSIKKRPTRNNLSRELLIENLKKSKFYKLFEYLFSCNFIYYDTVKTDTLNITTKLTACFKEEILTPQLQQEVFVNALLPLYFLKSNIKQKQELLHWYWNAKSIATYGILKRKYPLHSQKYIFVQQALLEQHKEYNDYQNYKTRDLLNNYDLPVVFTYNELDKPPFYIMEDEIHKTENSFCGSSRKMAILN